MLRAVGAQLTLWYVILPPSSSRCQRSSRRSTDFSTTEVLRSLSGVSSTNAGTPFHPHQVYLLLMFLKYRYRLGFEPLVKEVADSIRGSASAASPLADGSHRPR